MTRNQKICKCIVSDYMNNEVFMLLHVFRVTKWLLIFVNIYIYIFFYVIKLSIIEWTKLELYAMLCYKHCITAHMVVVRLFLNDCMPRLAPREKFILKVFWPIDEWSHLHHLWHTCSNIRVSFFIYLARV